MKVEQIRLRSSNDRRAPSCSYEYCDVNIYIKYWKTLSENLSISFSISFMRSDNESFNLESNPFLFTFTILNILISTLTQNYLIPGQQYTFNYSFGPLRKSVVQFGSSIKSDLQSGTCGKLKELRGEFGGLIHTRISVVPVCHTLILTRTLSD
jgi:hypothetical protein